MTTPFDDVPGTLRTYDRDGRSLILYGNGFVRIALTPLTPGIIRVRLAPQQMFAPRPSWAVTPPDEDFPAVPFTLHETQQALTITTELLRIHVQRQPLRISFSNSEGHAFCADERGMEVGETGVYNPLFVTEDGVLVESARVSCAKRIEADEHFFGFGERTGHLDKLGRQMTNWATDQGTQTTGTDPLYITIPFLMGVRPGLAYGVFLNNTWRSRFSVDWDRPGAWLMEAVAGELDYYVIYGPQPADVTEGLSRLLGTMPLPPLWALGHHQSRWGYHTEKQVREVAARFRQRDIPCDVIHLDIDYMDGYRDFTWNAERFPHPQKLIGDLREQGFRTVSIIDAGVKVDPAYAVYNEGIEKDMFIRLPDGSLFTGYVWPGKAAFADFARADVRAWWGDLHARMAEVGISGIWNDMNEPTVFERTIEEGVGKIGTIDLEAVQGADDERTTHAEVHNLYGSGMSQAAYEGMQRHLDGERPFVLTRSAFAGIQRWSACWMGDNNSWWEHLEMAMPQLLNMGLSGVPFVGTDIGGFFGNCDGELLARWIQFGVLSPFCRNHSAFNTVPQEPWVFGERVEAIYRDYVKFRYRLLPYLYTLFWEASQRGTPVLRPLLYHFPDDTSTYALHDEVLLGPWLLAAPVYQPGRTHRAVYLPAGEWFDWWTDTPISGPTHVLAHAPLERMPLYVRAGAIIPMGPEMRYTDEKPLDPLTLEVYPGEGTLTLYEDDGETFAYQQGQCCTTQIHMQRSTRSTGGTGEGSAGSREEEGLLLQIGARTGAYSPPPRQLIIRLHGVGAMAARDHSGARYSPDQRLLLLQFADDGSARTLWFPLA